MQDQGKKDEVAKDKAADVKAATEAMELATGGSVRAAQGDFVKKIVEKIRGAENILIAVSRNPSVDELAAAIGLTVFLDNMQHHVTAIYSGKTPDALQFLQPEATFETTTDSLQDFIIALDKDKADHLRYKLEGDFVKVFITPYKTSITEKDLSFSRGDYNVDFVIAINVRSAGDLDEALMEHGKIMHDASAVNITRNEPGRFGEIEWSSPVASSVCEMVTQLVFELQGQDKTLDNDVATALLTGIVAATERFSNERTNSDTLSLASKLMELGANQQLITANVMTNTKVGDPTPTAPVETPKANEELPYDTTGVMAERFAAQMQAVADIQQATQTPPTPVALNVGTPNPAAQMAQGVPEPKGPEPAQFVIPEMPNSTMGAVPTREAATSEPMNTGMVQAGVDIAPAQPVVTENPVVMPDMQVPTMPVESTPEMQPVENPAVVLPPPPAPPVGMDMMPPVLPEVQVPEGMQIANS